MNNIIEKFKEFLPKALGYFFDALPILVIYQAVLLVVAPTVTNRVMSVVLLGLFLFKLWMKRR